MLGKTATEQAKTQQYQCTPYSQTLKYKQNRLIAFDFATAEIQKCLGSHMNKVEFKDLFGLLNISFK